MVQKEKQIELAKTFLKLHQNQGMFVMPNVWNGGSAKIFEKQGFKALGTTSAGIAYSLGYPDGEIISIEDLCLVTKQISKRISIPLSVDIERGYGLTIQEITNNVKKIIIAGAVGINIEDGYPSEKPYLESLELQLQKIKAISQLREEMKIPFVINARTCVCWLKIGNKEKNLDIAIERCVEYVKNGADCVFVPGLLDDNSIKYLVSKIDAPLNIIASPVSQDLNKLESLGVKRLSIGSGGSRSTLNHLIEISRELYENQSIELMISHKFSYNIANDFFSD